LNLAKLSKTCNACECDVKYKLKTGNTLRLGLTECSFSHDSRSWNENTRLSTGMFNFVNRAIVSPAPLSLWLILGMPYTQFTLAKQGRTLVYTDSI